MIRAGSSIQRFHSRLTTPQPKSAYASDKHIKKNIYKTTLKRLRELG